MDVVDEEGLCRPTSVRRHWLRLAGCAEPSGLARRHVRKILEGRASPERIDDAVLVASELVGNALRHTAGGPDCMCVEVHEDVAVVRVHDAGRDVSRVRARSAKATRDELADSGLGLVLVEELACEWVVQTTPISGKEVIVVLALDAGGLTERKVRVNIPAVSPPFTAEFHQLHGAHGEFDGREGTQS
ncbi:ATP-binding protein [Streptomyces sp. NPDC087903]|uniref:ATP-binding protein n=1 Tax=Streptomyces sp. NPDC087903 TaxID=3365819 RepID=UPI003826C289